MFYGATPVLPVEQATSFRLSDNAQNPAIGLTITSPTLALSDSATQAAIFHGSNQSREMRTAERQNRLQMEITEFALYTSECTFENRVSSSAKSVG